MQASLNLSILQAFLHSVSNFDQEYSSQCRSALEAIYNHAIQEVLVPIIFISEQLLTMI